MNLFCKRLLMKKPVIVFETSTAGTYNIELAAGRFEITAIGGGGGGTDLRSVVVYIHGYAKGGVGGTLVAIVNNYVSNNITITIGNGGNSASGTFGGAGTNVQANDGGDTTVVGIPGLTLTAGRGHGGRVQSISTTGSNRYPGAQGTNVISGTSLVQIVANNAITITSPQGTGTGSVRQPVRVNNTNFPENPAEGSGGDAGWNGNNFILMQGGSGFIRIRRM